MKITPSEPAPSNDELVVLVDRYLDQRLDEAGGKRLEEILREDPQAKAYLAGKIRFHSELETLANPLRIAIHEGRELVIEQSGGQSTVTVNRSGSVSVEPVLLDKPGKSQSGWPIKALVGLLGVLLIVIVTWFIYEQNTENTPVGTALLSITPLDNHSFEYDKLNDGDIRGAATGWEIGSSMSRCYLFNPATDPKNNSQGGAHLPNSEVNLDGENVLVIACDSNGAAGWIRQKLYGQTALGSRALQFADIDGLTLRATVTLARPALGSSDWADQLPALIVSIQEKDAPYRVAALKKVAVDPEDEGEVEVVLDLDNDSLTTITVDLEMDAADLRGDTYFSLRVDPSSKPGSEVYIDQIQLELAE